MSKARIAVLSLVLAALAASPVAAQVVQKKLVTLGPGETLVTDESILLGCAGPDCAAGDWFMVTRAERSGKVQYFILDKSGRKGPYDKVLESMLKPKPGCEPTPAYDKSESSMNGLGVSGDGKSLTFKGKTFGPFQQVMGAAVAPGGSRFYALVAKAGQLRFIASDGRDVPAKGMPEKIVIGPGGTKAVAVCIGTLTLIEGVKVDPSKIDASAFESTSLFTIDGQAFGPFGKDKDFGEIWFTADAPNWLFNLGRTVYFNGAALKPFPERVNKSTFWIDDASHYAWVAGEELRFSDGAVYYFPVMVRPQKGAGKTTLCWISVQKNGDVVAYSRSL